MDEGEEVIYSRNNTEENLVTLNEEELDYDSAGLDEQLGLNEDGDFETVDSVVEFRIPKTNKEEQQKRQPLIDPEDLEGYIQSIVDSRWKEREAELLRKHNITVSGEGENINDNHRVIRSNNDADIAVQTTPKDRVKSPSDTTIYALALNKTPVRDIVNFNIDKQVYQSPMWNVSERVATVIDDQNNIDDQISNFIEGVRKKQNRAQPTTSTWN